MKHSEKIQNLIKELTLEEKCALLSGKSEWESVDVPRLSIPSIVCSDGPSGVRRQMGKGDHLGLNESLPATCFPSAATVANSWDTALAEDIGRALGEEAVCLDVDVLLGPGLNIKRSPLCGRNFEYFSEDPYLAGKMAAGYIRGIQSTGTSACPKHFAVNSQEERRMATNSVVDERTLREIYLTGFEIAVKEGQAKTLMTSYNEVNGVYANENKHLLQEILRDEWGYEGMVVTDWGGSNDHVAGVAAGSNLEMPCPGYDSALQLIQAYEEKRISMEEIDRCVEGLLDTVFFTKKKTGEKTGTVDVERHHALARKAAAESIVLLKNRAQILPLHQEKKAVIIGDFARLARYQGAGSSNVKCTKLENICDLAPSGLPGYAGYAQGYRRNSGVDEALEREALALAEKSEVILYFFGLDEINEAEGQDRTHMRIPGNQVSLLRKLSELNIPIVGVLEGGSAIEMPWENCCQALVHAYLGGQAGASAILDVLTGKVNPGGKLNETYPLCYEDTPACEYFPAKKRNAEYREGIYVGYRYYDTVQAEVRYPFGHGLSYTQFAYSDLKISEEEVSFTLKNTGGCRGAEVAQVYVACSGNTVFHPAKELKGFARIELEDGESRHVVIPLDDKAFRYWNGRTNRWERGGGTYQILVGSSSRDIRLTGFVAVTGTEAPCPYERAKAECYFTGNIHQVSDTAFSELLGGPVPEDRWSEELTVNDALCQMEHARSGLARFAFRIIRRKKESSERAGKPDLNILFIYNIPFRAIAKMTQGMVSMKMAEGMVTAVNGHFWKGMRAVIGGFFENRKANKQFQKRL